MRVALIAIAVLFLVTMILWPIAWATGWYNVWTWIITLVSGGTLVFALCWFIYDLVHNDW